MRKQSKGDALTYLPCSAAAVPVAAPALDRAHPSSSALASAHRFGRQLLADKGPHRLLPLLLWDKGPHRLLLLLLGDKGPH